MVATTVATKAVQNPTLTVGVVVIGGVFMWIAANKIADVVPDLVGDAVNSAKAGAAKAGEWAVEGGKHVGGVVVDGADYLTQWPQDFISGLMGNAEKTLDDVLRDAPGVFTISGPIKPRDIIVDADDERAIASYFNDVFPDSPTVAAKATQFGIDANEFTFYDPRLYMDDDTIVMDGGFLGRLGTNVRNITGFLNPFD